MDYVDVVIAVNVHEDLQFVHRQIRNLQTHLQCSHVIIYHPNRRMGVSLSQCPFIASQPQVLIHPNRLEKRRFHGSLTQGIVENLQLALSRYKFSRFLVLSSRNLFYKPLKFPSSVPDIFLDVDIHRSLPANRGLLSRMSEHPKLRGTLLGTRHSNWKAVSLAHEGFMFDYAGAIGLDSFLSANIDVSNDLFQYEWCLEESALQTILYNQRHPIYHIGVYTGHFGIRRRLPSTKYVYKTLRGPQIQRAVVVGCLAVFMISVIGLIILRYSLRVIGYNRAR